MGIVVIVITVLYFLFVYSLSNIISKEDIFYGFRESVYTFNEKLHSLVTCTVCLSFWVGLMTSLIINTTNTVFESPSHLIGIPFYIACIIDAVLAAGVTKIIEK